MSVECLYLTPTECLSVSKYKVVKTNKKTVIV